MPRPAEADTIAFCRSLAWATAVICCALVVPAHGQEPLHERIDRLIEADQFVPLASQASDAEFVRRATLDLVGRIPSTAEAREFAADASADKRARLIDRLLASPEYPRHMSNVFDVALMERRPEKSVPTAEWQKYLYESFAANKPYDQLVREILLADGVEPDKRAQARFYLDREGEANLLTRDVGRIFLGMDLQCAQCHDHPLISDYYQSDYQGLFAFFNRSTLFTDKEKKVFFAEKADGDVNYQSVFDATRKGIALPQLPGGEPVPDQTFAKGEEYVVAPADGVRPVPKYSRRARLPEQLTAGANRQFSRAIVNRLWAQMMGRGLIDPVDLDHGDNPPSHPAVLDLLADAFPTMKYDIKALLGELARTRVYGRSIDLPAELAERGGQLTAQIDGWDAQKTELSKAADASQEAAAKIGAELAAARAAEAPIAAEFAQAKTALAEAQKNADNAAQVLASAQAALPAKQEAAKLVAEANAKTAEAAQKLADDKELLEAATKLKTRSEQLAAEVAALTKTTTEGPATVKTTSEQLAAAQQKVAEIGPKLEPLAAQVATLRTAAKAADARARTDRAALAATAAQVADAKTVVSFAAALPVVVASQAAIESASTQLAGAQRAVAEMQPEMDRAAQLLVAAQQEASAASTALESARKAHAEQQATLDAVREALAKTQVAQERLPQSAELAQAVGAIKAKVDQLAEEAKPGQLQIAEREVAAKNANDAMTAAQQNVAAATAARDNLVEQSAVAEKAVTTAREQAAAAAAALDDARRSVAEKFAARSTVAVLKHLTPEQFAMSMLQASGTIDRERAAVSAEWDKNHPTPDAAAQAARAAEIEKALVDKLKPSVQSVVSLFAAGAGQPQQAFQSTVDQALFLANGGNVRSWIAPAEGNLADRVTKLTDPQQAASELYLTALSRQPTDAEVAEVAACLAGRDADRAAAVQEMVWGLFCSAEFRFNH